MNVQVFFFSGTGNSYAVARDIAQATEAELVAIGSVLDQAVIKVAASAVVIVFPRYYGSNKVELPLAVAKFLQKAQMGDAEHIYVVCTYGGGVGKIFSRVDEILKTQGRRLSGGYGVHMPQNAFRKPFENIPRLLGEWNRKKAQICLEILEGREGHFDRDGVAFRLLSQVLKTFVDFRKIEKNSIAKCAGMPVELPVEQLMQSVDNSYEVDGRCNGCGICVRVCPVKNVSLVDKLPVWQHRCENCLACYNWCPESAIHGGIADGYHYSHPEVRASELMKMQG